MAEHVEARSLAELNYLAANPPQYPTNPTEKKQDPVVLYISRVPGTRDIILSPFKPQLKNVTANDVASSLYYVHLDTPEDDLLVPPEQTRASSSPRSSSESRRNQIQRKPLPASAITTSSNLSDRKDTMVDPATHTIHPALRQDYKNNDQPVQQPAPYSHFDHSFFLPPQKPAGPPAGPIQRKPLGLRSRATSNSTDMNPRPVPPHGPPLPPRPYQQENNHIPADKPHAPLSPSPIPNRPIRSPSPNKRRFKPFSLTLIRRDRASDEQWNVGKISSYQLPLEHPDPLLYDDRQTRSQSSQTSTAPSILIHIESSGYAKFRGMPTQPSLASGGDSIKRPSFDMLRPHSSGTNSVSRLGGLGSGIEEFLQQQQSNFAPVPAHGGFEREVKMAYSPSLTANIRQAFKGRRRSSGSPTSPIKSPGGHGRQDSSSMSIRSFGGGDFDFGSPGGGGGSGGNSASASASAESSLVTHPGPGLKPRGYVFDSPWGGRCEFLTGNAGRTLRCRHILPNFSGNVFNPLVADGGSGADGEHGGRGGGSGGGSGGHHSGNRKALTVSELRFNLPSSEVLFSKDVSGSPRARDQIQGQFQRILNNAAAAKNKNEKAGCGGGNSNSGSGTGGNYHYYNSSEGDDDYYDINGNGSGNGGEMRLDMSLGREKAGGGNRGSRAKMGKLIITPDGLKMLDLVVAANVGVWWTSWERTFGDETW